MAKAVKVNPKVQTRTSKPDDDDSGVLSRVKPIGFDDTGISLLLYGRSGTGKTTLWGTFPGKTLAVVCSGGSRPGELRSIDTKENRKRIQQVVLRRADELNELVEALRGGALGEFDNVVLDHLGGYYELVLRGVLGIGDAEVVNKKFGAITIGQYGEASQTFKTNVRPLLGLPQNVVLIAHERTFNGSEDGGGGTDADTLEEAIKPSVGADMSEKLTNWVNGAVDYLARTFIRPQTKTKMMEVAGERVKTTTKTGKVEYCLQVGPSGTYHTKFRVPGGIRETVVVNPTYDKIMALVRGEADEQGE